MYNTARELLETSYADYFRDFEHPLLDGVEREESPSYCEAWFRFIKSHEVTNAESIFVCRGVGDVVCDVV